jgi:DnaK suppressor protein
MAKATKAADKKSTKPAAKTAAKAPVKAVAKAAPKPAPKAPSSKNGKGVSEPPPRAASAGRAAADLKAPAPKASPKADGKQEKIDTSQLAAHPDAKLSQKEVKSLFDKLLEEKNRVISGFDSHVQDALSDDDALADEIDIAQRSTDQAWLFRLADKERKKLIEIDAAIEKMRNGEYGICEGTDEAIGFKRLELRPWTRYSVAYKEMLEREKAQQAR